MKIGVIGAGRMGGTLAVLLARAGHTVYVANSRGPESLQPLVDEAGANATAVSVADAARSGEVVIVALPWGARDGLPEASLFNGKIVVDAMNAFDRPRTSGKPVTSTEETAATLPGARMVKAFNTMNFQVMRAKVGQRGPDQLALYAASDDADAKQVVLGLIEDLGFTAVDTGTLHDGGLRQQPGGPLFNTDLTATEAQAKLQA